MRVGLGPKTRQGHLTLQRWLDRFALGTLGASMVSAARPALQLVLDRLPGPPDAAWLSLPVVLLAFAIVVAVARPAVARRWLWPSRCLRHPGWVVAAAIGFTLVALMLGTEHVVDASEALAVPAAFGLLGLLLWLASAALPLGGDPLPPVTDPTPIGREVDRRNAMEALLKDPEKLQAWIDDESPLTANAVDLLGVGSATRRVRDAMRLGLTVGLLGGFGSGKSTLVERAHAPLRKEIDGQRHVLAAVDAAGLEPEHAAAAVLAAGLDALRPHFDVLGFAGLPAAYEAAARGLTPAGFRWIFDLPAVDPLRQLARLNDALQACGLTLTFDVRDLDRRADPSASLAGLQALLDRLRDDDCKRLNFVISVGENAGLDLARLCQRVVHLGDVPADMVRQICNATRKMHLKEALDADVLLADAEPGSLNGADLYPKLAPWYLAPPATKNLEVVPLDLDAALICVLDTPRMLKAVLRAVSQNWILLRGEIDHTYLLLFETVRLVAPQALLTLSGHLDLDRRRLPRRVVKPVDDRDRVAADARMEALLPHLGDVPAKRDALLAICHTLAGSQHLNVMDPSDGELGYAVPWQTAFTDPRYFHRALGVSVSRDDALWPSNDQDVLQALVETRKLKSRRLRVLLRQGAASFDAVWTCVRNPDVWTPPRFRIDIGHLQLAALVETLWLLLRHRAAASIQLDGGVLPKLAALCSPRGTDQHPPEERAKMMIEASLKRSLQLAVDQLHCWAFGRHFLQAEAKIDPPGGLSEDQQWRVYEFFCGQLQARVGVDPGTLCGLLHHDTPEYLLLLHRIVFLSGAGEPRSHSRPAPQDWLKDLVELGLEQGLAPIADLVAGLATSDEPVRDSGPEHPYRPQHLQAQLHRLHRWLDDPEQERRILERTIEILRQNLSSDLPAWLYRWRVGAADVLENSCEATAAAESDP